MAKRFDTLTVTSAAREHSRSNGDGVPTLTPRERESIESMLRDNSPTNSHKVTLNDEVKALMRSGLSEDVSRNLVEKLRENGGVSTLALALPNPGGVGVRPPNLDEIRRNGSMNMARKNGGGMTPAQEAALARGRAALARLRAGKGPARENISQANFNKLVKEGRAVRGDAFVVTKGKGDRQVKRSLVEDIQARIDKADKDGRKPRTSKPRDVRAYVIDSSGNRVMGTKTITPPNRLAKYDHIVQNPEDFAVIAQTRYKIDQIKTDKARAVAQVKKVEADNAVLEQRVAALSAKLEKQANRALTQKQLERSMTDKAVKAREALQNRLAKFKAAQRASVGDLIDPTTTAEYLSRDRKSATPRKASSTKKAGVRKMTMAQWLAEQQALRGADGEAARANSYRDNASGSAVLYGVGGFAGGLLGGVVATNLTARLFAKPGQETLRTWVPRGVAALIAFDLYRTSQGGGMVFNRIENPALRYSLGLGLILPMLARGVVSSMLGSLGSFGRKIDGLLLGDEPSAAPALPGPVQKGPGEGIGSVYDLAFDEQELPTSGVGRYVATEGVGRYVATEGLGVNVTEAPAGVGVNVTEATAGMGRYVATQGLGVNVTEATAGTGSYEANQARSFIDQLDDADEMNDGDLAAEGLGAMPNVKTIMASPATASRVQKAFDTAGHTAAITFLRPSNVRPNTYIVGISRPGAESAKQALSQMTPFPSQRSIPPATLPNAIMTRGIFARPMFPVVT